MKPSVSARFCVWMATVAYHVLVKAKNWHRAAELAATVIHWYPDSQMSDQEVGWATQPYVYAQPTHHLSNYRNVF